MAVEQPTTCAASRGLRPCQATSVSSSLSGSGSAASAVSTEIRSATSSATSGAACCSFTHTCISAAIDSCLTVARNWLVTTFLATTSSHGSTDAGISPRRRQATRKTSLTTSSASPRPARLTA